jgi:Cu2+-exporting ATPase
MIKYVFKVDGMMCGNCEKHAVGAVKKAVSVKTAVASHIDKTVEITAKKPVDENAVKLAIEDRGYAVLGVEKFDI